MPWLTRDDLNPRVLDAEYAVRGELAIKAGQLAKRLEAGEVMPFDRIIYCNIGNPQQLGQKPITFFRQVMSLVQCPWMLEDERLHEIYPEDAIARARHITKHVSSIGAYSHSKGLQFVREDIAKFICERDGYPANPEDIFVTDGASEGIKRILQCAIKDEKSGVLLPIPQYPLYSAAVTLLGGQIVPYYLDESRDWDLSIEELSRATQEARAQGIEVRVLCLINPGNPTGNHFSESTLRDIIQFCSEEKLLLVADEVYQSNIWDGRPFVSMKKIACDLKLPIQLVSVHSTSKGFIGECGKRSGYMECYGLDEDVLGEIYKLASVGLCPNVDGQLTMSLMVAPPRPGDASFTSYTEEVAKISESMKRRSALLTEALNSLEGIECCEPAGAMYLFPSFKLPLRFLEESSQLKRQADALYCLLLLEATGICAVPGSGFGQHPGTHHIRLTCLPPEETFPQFIKLFKDFHQKFLLQYK